MSAEDDLRALADLCGVLPAYYDLNGGLHVAGPDTLRAMVAASGIDVSNDAAVAEALGALRHQIHDRWFPEEVIVEAGQGAPLQFGLGAVWHLHSDDADRVVAEGAPADYITLPPLAAGVYQMTASASGRTEHVTVIAAPRRLPDVGSVTGRDRHWGVNCALYGLRGDRGLGLGDYADLGHMAEIAGRRGASFVGINPIHTMGHSNVAAISPYSPSHRGFLNTTHIALDAIPGLEGAVDATPFAEVARAETVQYQAHKRAHNAALDTLFTRFQTEGAAEAVAAFDRYADTSDAALATFARFEALSEGLGDDWRAWPGEVPDPPQDRVRFHIWLQWVAEAQLAAAQDRARRAGMPLGLYLDLAVGPRRDGAEAWCERDAIAQGVSIGAPPDHLGPEGQNWDLAAFAPRKLRAQRYAPLRRILAQTMRHAGIIRIDHVLGLNRSFWVPDDGSPGAYMRQPFEALLAIIKIEAARHNCIVIGEDLGLVPDGFRETMHDAGFYGYSVLQYERGADDHLRDPSYGPAQVLSCFATHDTPTVAGFATARDVAWWERLGWIDADAAADLRARRAGDVAAWGDADGFAAQVTQRLAHAGAALVTVQLDDVLGLEEAQNLPGTVDEHPNWRRKYAPTLDTLEHHAPLHATAATMAAAGRGHSDKGYSDDH
ncbi:MAG: 4-alpha-glucanotransferase [Pseudomonadota bacterium]